MNPRIRLKWLINYFLFISFLIAYFLDLTGLYLHQWLGLIVGAIAFFHLLNHWKWIQAVTQRFFKSTSNLSRLYYLLDAFLLFGLAAIILTGLIISTWFGLQGSAYGFWRSVHILASISTLVLLFIKLFLHWKSISNAVKSFFTRPSSPYPQTVPSIQNMNATMLTRRDALRTIGILSLATGISLYKAVSSLKIPELEGLSSTSQENVFAQPLDSSQPATSGAQAQQPDSQSFAAPATNSSASDCVVRCPNGCSYPGRCRRYTDNNNNNLCDLGECL